MVSALTLGETVEQIAVAHEVPVSTVRAQVRSIFEDRSAPADRFGAPGAERCPLVLKPDRLIHARRSVSSSNLR